jgi:hypothetical protein
MHRVRRCPEAFRQTSAQHRDVDDAPQWPVGPPAWE